MHNRQGLSLNAILLKNYFIQSICTNLCQEKSNLFNKVPLSRMTIRRLVEDLAKDANEPDRLAGCTDCSIALDESTETTYTDTGQFLVYVRSVNSNFEISQELIVVNLQEVWTYSNE